MPKYLLSECIYAIDPLAVKIFNDNTAFSIYPRDKSISILSSRFTPESVIEEYNKHHWTLPDSFIIAMIIYKLFKNKEIYSEFIYHKGGCKFGEFTYLDLPLDMKYSLREYKGLSYEIKKCSLAKNLKTNTVLYSLDKKMWTKQYKMNMMMLFKLQGIW